MASDYSGDEFEEDNYDDGHFVTSGPPSSRHDASEGSSFFGDGNGQDSIERMLGVLGKPSGGKTSPVDADARAVREMVASYSSNSIKLQSTPAIVPYKSNFDPPGAAPDSAEVEDDQEASQASYDDDGFAEDDGGDVEDTGEYSAADEPTPRPPPELPAPPPPSEVMELLSPQASAAAVKSSVARTFPIPSLVVDEQKEEGKHTQEEEEEEEERYTEDDAYGSDEFATDHEPVLSPKQSSLGNVAPSFSRHSLPRAQADEQEPWTTVAMVPSPPPARVGVSSSYESPKDPGLAKLSSRGTPRTPLLSGGSSVSAKSTQPVVVAPVPPIVSLPVIPEPVIITSSKPNSHTSSAVSLHGVPSLPPPQYPVAPVSQLAHSASTASSTHSQPHNPPTDHNTAAHPVNAVHAAPHNHPEPKHNAPDHSGSHQHAAHNPVRHGRSPRASSESLTAAKSVYVPQRRSSNASNASGRSAHPPPPLDTHTDGTRSPVADSAVPLPSLSSPPLTTHAHPPAHAAHAAPHYALPTHAHPAQGPHPQPHPTYAHDVLPQLPTPMHVTHSQPGLPSDALPHYALPTHAHPVTEPPPAPTHSSEPVTSQPYASHAHPSQPHAQSMHAQSVHAQSLHGQRRAHGQQGKPHRESHPVPPTVEARIREEAARVRAATTIQLAWRAVLHRRDLKHMLAAKRRLAYFHPDGGRAIAAQAYMTQLNSGKAISPRLTGGQVSGGKPGASGPSVDKPNIVYHKGKPYTLEEFALLEELAAWPMGRGHPVRPLVPNRANSSFDRKPVVPSRLSAPVRARSEAKRDYRIEQHPNVFGPRLYDPKSRAAVAAAALAAAGGKSAAPRSPAERLHQKAHDADRAKPKGPPPVRLPPPPPPPASRRPAGQVQSKAPAPPLPAVKRAADGRKPNSGGSNPYAAAGSKPNSGRDRENRRADVNKAFDQPPSRLPVHKLRAEPGSVYRSAAASSVEAQLREQAMKMKRSKKEVESALHRLNAGVSAAR